MRRGAGTTARRSGTLPDRRLTVLISDRVFLGAGVRTANDKTLIWRDPDHQAVLNPPWFDVGANVGSGATILAGVTIGQRALVGAGSTVTREKRMASFAVGALRVEAAKRPYDRELSNLIGELSTRSDTFRVMWGSHDVHVFRQSTKRLNHPLVGDLELDQETMSLPDESGLSVVVYSAPPDTAAEDGLKLLASWSATTGQELNTQSASEPSTRQP